MTPDQLITGIHDEMQLSHGGTLWDMVIEDMKLRDQFGMKKYGRPLLPSDGRDTLHDAYEEALDLAVYLKKALVERDGKR